MITTYIQRRVPTPIRYNSGIGMGYGRLLACCDRSHARWSPALDAKCVEVVAAIAEVPPRLSGGLPVTGSGTYDRGLSRADRLDADPGPLSKADRLIKHDNAVFHVACE